MGLVMITQFIGLMAFAMIFAAHAETLDARLVSDKSHCSEAASKKYTWILNMSQWRETYNECLRQRLKGLSPLYVNSTLEALKLESECPPEQSKGPIIEFSMTGFEIAKHLTPRDLQKDMTSINLEETLELYYQRIDQSKKRIKELKH